MASTGKRLRKTMERSTMPLMGKLTISMGHLYHGYVSHNQRVCELDETDEIGRPKYQPIRSNWMTTEYKWWTSYGQLLKISHVFVTQMACWSCCHRRCWTTTPWMPRPRSWWMNAWRATKILRRASHFPQNFTGRTVGNEKCCDIRIEHH